MNHMILVLLMSTFVFSTTDVYAGKKSNNKSSSKNVEVEIVKATWGKGLIKETVTKDLQKFIDKNRAMFPEGADQWVFSNDTIGTSKDLAAKASWQVKVLGKGKKPGINKELVVEYKVYGKKQPTAKIKQGDPFIILFDNEKIVKVLDEAIVLPKDFMLDSGKIIDIACGCDKNGKSTAYMIGFPKDEDELPAPQKLEMKKNNAKTPFDILEEHFEVKMSILDSVKTSPLMTKLSKVYAYIPSGRFDSDDAWDVLESKCDDGSEITAFLCLAASSTGNLIAVRTNDSEVVSYDFANEVWKKLPGKPSDMKIYKLCIADENNIYAIANVKSKKISIYKYNSKTPGWDAMPGTENVIDFSIAMDGTFVGINNDSEIKLYAGNNKWTDLSAKGDKFKSVAVQNKDNFFAVDKKGVVCKWNASSKTFEKMTGSTWKYNKAEKDYVAQQDSDKVVLGYKDVAVNAGGMCFLITRFGKVAHNGEADIVVKPATTTAAVVSGVAAPVVSSQVVKTTSRRASRTTRKGATKRSTGAAVTTTTEEPAAATTSTKKTSRKGAVRSTRKSAVATSTASTDTTPSTDTTEVASTSADTATSVDSTTPSTTTRKGATRRTTSKTARKAATSSVSASDSGKTAPATRTRTTSARKSAVRSSRSDSSAE